MRTWTSPPGKTASATPPIDVNLIYSHAGDRAQLAASEAIEKRLEAVQEEVQKRLSVTPTVTQQQGVSATY